MGSGRRYEKSRKPKLNMKKVIGVIVAIAVVIMFGISISKLLSTDNQKQQNQIKNYYFAAYQDGKWGVINQAGNEVYPFNQEEMIIVPDNTKGVFILTTEVDYETETYKTIAKNDKGETLFSDYEMVEAIDNFDDAGNLWYEDDVLRVRKDGKYGIINLEGERLLDCQYDKIESLKGIDNSLIIQKDGKVGIASDIGEIIVEPQYSKVLPFGTKYSDGYIVTGEDGKSGIIGGNKKTVLEPIYEEVRPVVSTNLYVVKQDGVLKVINSEGQAIIESGYDDFVQIAGQTIIAKKGEQYGAINTDGEEIIPFEYQELTYVLNQYYIAKKDDKYGILKQDNTTALPFEYTYIQNRKDTDFLEAETESALTEVYNKDMQLQITGILSEVNTEKGYIIARIEGDWKFYNFKFEEKTEKEIFPEHTLLLSKENGKYGYKNQDGTLIVDHIYDDAKLQNEYGYCSVKQGNLWGSIGRDGNISQAPQVNLDDYLIVDFIGSWHYGKELEMNYYTK